MIFIIIKKRREVHIEQISKQFIKIYKNYHGIKTALIKTAVEIDDNIRKIIVEKLEDFTKSQIELIEEIKKAGIYRQIWQAFAIFLPVKSVGVMGDYRTYEYLCALRIVESIDAMTANFAKLDWGILEQISTRIINEVKGINRVVYDISNKPPATIEFE